jgi:hypothetical protein
MGPRGSAPTARDRLLVERLIWLGLLGGVVAFLVLGLALGPRLRAAGGLGGGDVLSDLSVAAVVLLVPLARVLRSNLRPPAPVDAPPASYWRKRLRAQVVSLALLEAPALFCVVALLASDSPWPRIAVLFPLAMMVAWFPREAAGP